MSESMMQEIRNAAASSAMEGLSLSNEEYDTVIALCNGTLSL